MPVPDGIARRISVSGRTALFARVGVTFLNIEHRFDGRSALSHSRTRPFATAPIGPLGPEPFFGAMRFRHFKPLCPACLDLDAGFTRSPYLLPGRNGLDSHLV